MTTHSLPTTISRLDYFAAHALAGLGAHGGDYRNVVDRALELATATLDRLDALRVGTPPAQPPITKEKLQGIIADAKEVYQGYSSSMDAIEFIATKFKVELFGQSEPAPPIKPTMRKEVSRLAEIGRGKQGIRYTDPALVEAGQQAQKACKEESDEEFVMRWANERFHTIEGDGELWKAWDQPNIVAAARTISDLAAALREKGVK